MKKLDYRITDKEDIDAGGLIIQCLGGIYGKFYDINFVQYVKKRTN